MLVSNPANASLHLHGLVLSLADSNGTVINGSDRLSCRPRNCILLLPRPKCRRLCAMVAAAECWKQVSNGACVGHDVLRSSSSHTPGQRATMAMLQRFCSLAVFVCRREGFLSIQYTITPLARGFRGRTMCSAFRWSPLRRSGEGLATGSA